MSSGWIFLGAMVVAYGIGNLLQSVAAARTTHERRFHLSLLLRLCGHRIYLAGIGCQFLGFLLAFAARRDLPLFLVQASVAAGLGVTALLGVAVLKWRLPLAEVVLLAVLSVGICGLVLAARPAPSQQLAAAGVAALGIAVVVIALAGLFAARLRGARGSVALGSLAGLAFGAAAVAARPLAAAHSWERLFVDPLLYLLIANTILGQLLLGLAMQRGSTTAAVAAMDAAAAAPAAVIGLALLGDRIWPGREWLAAVGFVLTLGAVLGLTRYAQPQHQHARSRYARQAPAPARARELVATAARSLSR